MRLIDLSYPVRSEGGRIFTADGFLALTTTSEELGAEIAVLMNKKHMKAKRKAAFWEAMKEAEQFHTGCGFCYPHFCECGGG